MNTKNPLFVAVLVFVGIIGVAFAVDKVLTKKITQNVIQELKRDYTPGPYSPGFDPDKISPSQPQQQPPQQQPQQYGQIGAPQSVPYYVPLPTPQQWNQQWESSRF